jgi:hypothetical protein
MIHDLEFQKACGVMQSLAIHGASECAREKTPASEELKLAMNYLLSRYTKANSFAGRLFIDTLKR